MTNEFSPMYYQCIQMESKDPDHYCLQGKALVLSIVHILYYYFVKFSFGKVWIFGVFMKSCGDDLVKFGFQKCVNRHV